VFTRSGSSWTLQGAKLTPSDETGTGQFGYRLALAADGSTAVIAGPADNSNVGAVWVFTRSRSTWTQQGPKLTGSGETGAGDFGASVALAADGSTAVIAGPTDNSNVGAAWVFTRSGSTWTQQGAKLTGTGETGAGAFGSSVALSADGNTALIGGQYDNGNVGAAWVFTRSGAAWTQQGAKLTGADEITTVNGQPAGGGQFGFSVALSADGNTALIGGPVEPVLDWVDAIGGVRASYDAGAAWVFSRSGSTWTQQGPKLTATAEILFYNCPICGWNPSPHPIFQAYFGWSVALSADGNTALIGSPGECAPGDIGGNALAVARDDVAACGCPNSVYPNTLTPFNCAGGLTSDVTIGVGAARVFTRSGSTWTQGSKLAASDETGISNFGASTALSADANTALIGGPLDNSSIGAAWVFATTTGTTTTPTGTTTTPTGTTTTPTGAVQGVTTFLRAPFVAHGNEVDFTVRCAHATCHDRATETLTETLKGKQIASISAADHGRRTRVVKKTVTVASVTITIAAGATRKVTLKLNATGRALFARFARLPVHLTVTQRQVDGKLRTIKSVKLTVKRAPAKKGKH
jgi:FG-GAP repeat